MGQGVGVNKIEIRLMVASQDDSIVREQVDGISGQLVVDGTEEIEEKNEVGR